nr:ribonuclease H-like domain-containing protein [Tanacetum cinerariifolium]
MFSGGTLAQYVAHKTNVAQQFTPQMHYRLPHPGQGIPGPAPATYASQPTTLPSAFSIMPPHDPTWHMDTVTKPSASPIAFLSTSASTWHQRLGHPGDQVLRSLVSSRLISYQNRHNAMYDEYNALIKKGTWLLIPRSAGVNMVRSMRLFKHKFYADGTLSRYKARLVANGSSQQLGVDFNETFSSVVKPTTVRTVFSLAMSRKWPIHQLDVKNYFFNGDLSETMYMHHGLQVMPHELDFIIVAVIPHCLSIDKIIGSLNNEFDMTDLGAINYFLGIFTDRTPTGCPSTCRSTSGYCVFVGVIFCRGLLNDNTPSPAPLSKQINDNTPSPAPVSKQISRLL